MRSASASTAALAAGGEAGARDKARPAASRSTDCRECRRAASTATLLASNPAAALEAGLAQLMAVLWRPRALRTPTACTMCACHPARHTKRGYGLEKAVAFCQRCWQNSPEETSRTCRGAAGSSQTVLLTCREKADAWRGACADSITRESRQAQLSLRRPSHHQDGGEKTRMLASPMRHALSACCVRRPLPCRKSCPLSISVDLETQHRTVRAALQDPFVLPSAEEIAAGRVIPGTSRDCRPVEETRSRELWALACDARSFSKECGGRPAVAVERRCRRGGARGWS